MMLNKKEPEVFTYEEAAAYIIIKQLHLSATPLRFYMKRQPRISKKFRNLQKNIRWSTQNCF